MIVDCIFKLFIILNIYNFTHKIIFLYMLTFYNWNITLSVTYELPAVPFMNPQGFSNSSWNPGVIVGRLSSKRNLSINIAHVFWCILLIFLLSFSDQGGLKAQKHVSFQTGLRLVMGHGPYVKLVLAFLFTSLAFMVRKAL